MPRILYLYFIISSDLDAPHSVSLFYHLFRPECPAFCIFILSSLPTWIPAFCIFILSSLPTWMPRILYLYFIISCDLDAPHSVSLLYHLLRPGCPALCIFILSSLLTWMPRILYLYSIISTKRIRFINSIIFSDLCVPLSIFFTLSYFRNLYSSVVLLTRSSRPTFAIL